MSSEGKGFDDVETDSQTSIVTEHRVRAAIEVGDRGGFAELTTDWDRRRDFVIESAKKLRSMGHQVDVLSRRRVETVNFEEVPE